MVGKRGHLHCLLGQSRRLKYHGNDVDRVVLGEAVGFPIAAVAVRYIHVHSHCLAARYSLLKNRSLRCYQTPFVEAETYVAAAYCAHAFVSSAMTSRRSLKT